MYPRKFLSMLVAIALLSGTERALANAEASDRAYEMAAKYAAMSYYITPSQEGHAGFATTLEFNIPVNSGLDYIFILAGDHYCQDVNVWIESENGNTIVKDIRRTGNGLCGVRWRSDFNGTVSVVVHFARVSSRCGWAALVGRRGTPMNNVPLDSATAPTTPSRTDGGGGKSSAGEAGK